jgi:hypothetical protein
LSSDFFDAIENLSNEEIAFEAINICGDKIPAPVLKEIIADTLCFDFPVVEVEKAFIPIIPWALHGWTAGAVSCHVVFNRRQNESSAVLLEILEVLS